MDEKHDEHSYISIDGAPERRTDGTVQGEWTNPVKRADGDRRATCRQWGKTLESRRAKIAGSTKVGYSFVTSTEPVRPLIASRSPSPHGIIRSLALLLTGALILGASITTLRANAIESANYVVGPISLFGSYGGGTTASENYRVTLSWTSMSGRIRSSSRQSCLGFLCYSTGSSIFASLTVKSP